MSHAAGAEALSLSSLSFSFSVPKPPKKERGEFCLPGETAETPVLVRGRARHPPLEFPPDVSLRR
jgi:hypothetical protein